MILLPALKGFLKGTDVADLAQGGFWINHAENNVPRPNVIMQLMGGSDGMTHQGPDGLFRETVRIYSRADRDIDAARLGAAIKSRLHGARFISEGIAVQLCRHANGLSDFNEQAKVQRQIDSYVVSWRYNS